MEKKRQVMHCDCGGYFREVIELEGFSYPIMACEKCDHRVFTIAQAKQYVRLERLHEKLQRKRKIIRIGNALGLTIPKILESWGFKEGKKVTFERIGDKAFKIELG